jgi:hypothetical protein
MSFLLFLLHVYSLYRKKTENGNALPSAGGAVFSSHLVGCGIRFSRQYEETGSVRVRVCVYACVSA